MKDVEEVPKRRQMLFLLGDSTWQMIQIPRTILGVI